MLVIYSKPLISPGDRAWIDRVRLAHDPRHSIMEPHFTLVFPFDGAPVDQVIAHAAAIASTTSPIPVRLTRAGAVRDAFAPRSHVFLMPAEGEREVRRLHDRLYSGMLAPKLLPGVPFVPHVTVAACEQHEHAQQIAASLEPFEIPGRLDGMVLAEFDGATLEERRHFPFA